MRSSLKIRSPNDGVITSAASPHEQLRWTCANSDFCNRLHLTPSDLVFKEPQEINSLLADAVTELE
jgi:hypothetical protein